MMDPIPCHFYEDGQRKDGTLQVYNKTPSYRDSQNIQLDENHLVFQTGRFKDKTKDTDKNKNLGFCCA